MKFDVSVVMPLYNAKGYLKFAVDSVLNQTLKNVELVIVDDCSTDGSLDLCRELYGSNERVRIFQQPKNGGPGAARNRGISEARGEYIAFLDSDDEMMPDNLERMFTAAKAHNADVLHNNQIRMMLPMDDGSMPLELLSQPDNIVLFQLDRGEIVTEIQALPSDLNERIARWKEGRLVWSVCNKMIRRSLIVDNGIVFPDTTLAEDAIFCLQCLLTAKNYVIMPGGWYVVRTNETSITRISNEVSRVLKAIRAQLGVVKTLAALAKKIPVLNDKANFTAVVNTTLGNIEYFSLRLSFQKAGQEALRNDENLSSFFRETFGELSPYVEFLFFQLHETYPKLSEKFMDDPETIGKIKQAMKEAKSAGKEFVVRSFSKDRVNHSE